MEKMILGICAFLGIATAALVIRATAKMVNSPSKRRMKVAACAVLAAVILHPLSFGPVVWISPKLGSPKWLDVAAEHFYAPEDFASNNGPLWVRNAISAYWGWWLPENDTAAINALGQPSVPEKISN